MPDSYFQKWPLLWNLLQKWWSRSATLGLHSNFVENFLLEQHVHDEMFAYYRTFVSQRLRGCDAAESEADLEKALKAWLQAHEEYFHTHIRKKDSLSFDRDKVPTRVACTCNVLNGITGEYWLVHLRNIGDFLTRQDFTYSDFKAAFADFQAGRARKPFQHFLNRLNEFHDKRIGQPTFVGMAMDFAHCFEQGTLSPESPKPTLLGQYQENIGTILRDRLGIPYEKDLPVLLLCLKTSDLKRASESSRHVLTRPSVLDLPENHWFCPSALEHGKCGATVAFATPREVSETIDESKGDFPPCCELIHPQFPLDPERCLWVGRVQNDPPGDPAFSRSLHLKIARASCARKLAFCPEACALN